MKITLVVTDTKRRNLFFATEDGATHSLKEVVELASAGEFPGVYTVRGKNGEFLRTVPCVSRKEELEQLSISISHLYYVIQGMRNAASAPALRAYLETYRQAVRTARGSYIAPVEYPLPTSKKVVREKLRINRSHIFSAAKHFDIDPYILGAILIDEIARAIPFEPIVDKIKGDLLGRNASAGVAQVRLNTAYDLMTLGVYNPNLQDKRLMFSRFTNVERKYLYMYVAQPKHSIFFAGAFVRHVINFWSSYTDLSARSEIIGTLYHIGFGEPKSNPQSNPRGEQIAHEFYPLAKAWLKI